MKFVLYITFLYNFYFRICIWIYVYVTAILALLHAWIKKHIYSGETVQLSYIYRNV